MKFCLGFAVIYCGNLSLNLQTKSCNFVNRDLFKAKLINFCLVLKRHIILLHAVGYWTSATSIFYVQPTLAEFSSYNFQDINHLCLQFSLDVGEWLLISFINQFWNTTVDRFVFRESLLFYNGIFWRYRIFAARLLTEKYRKKKLSCDLGERMYKITQGQR